MSANAFVPASLAFTFVANDGHRYAVDVSWSRHLPSTVIVGPVFARAFRERLDALLSGGLHMPRMRCTITVHAEDTTAAPGTPLRERANALRRSGERLADALATAMTTTSYGPADPVEA